MTFKANMALSEGSRNRVSCSTTKELRKADRNRNSEHCISPAAPDTETETVEWFNLGSVDTFENRGYN